MAITFVQAATFNSTLATGSQAISITSTGGNTLIAAGSTVFEHLTGITDDAGNTWTFSTSAANNPPWQQFPTTSAAFVGWCIGASPVTTVTITTNFGGDHASYAVAEFSGIGSEDTGQATEVLSDATGNAVSGTLTLAGSSELVIGAANGDNNGFNGVPAGTTALLSPNLAYELGMSGSVQWTWPGRAPAQGIATAMAAFTAFTGTVAPAGLAASTGVPPSGTESSISLGMTIRGS